MSLYTSAQITEVLNSAPAVTPDMIFNNMGGAAYYGDVANATYQNMWYTYENAPAMYREIYLDPYLDAWQAGGGTVTPSAVEVLNTQPVVNAQTGVVEGTKAARMEAVTTPAGNVKAGAIAGRMPIGTLVAGAAIGAGVGLKEVAEHPKFWNDLSDAVFNDIKNPDTWIYNPNGSESETTEVIWRCLQDGGIQGYCDKRSIDAVIHNMYALGAFNVYGEVDLDVDHTGEQFVNVSSLNAGYLTQCGRLVDYYSINFETIVNAILAHYPTVTACEFTVQKTTLGTCDISVYCYSIPSGIYNVHQGTDGRYGMDIPYQYACGTCQAYLDVAGNIVGDIRFGDGISGGGIGFGIYQMSSNIARCSNVGCHYVAPNDAVIYNGTDQLPPENEADFWTVFSDWLANSFTNRSYDPLTNQYVDTTYVPFTAPDINWQTDPITGDQTRVWEGLYDFVAPFMNPTTDPVNNPSPWIFESIGNYVIPGLNTPVKTPWDNNPKLPTPTPTPIGSSPTIAAPSSGVSSGSKLYCVYNPSQTNIDALGAYLWTQNIIDMIEKFFSNNPLDAIISLHMIYCTPTTGASKNIFLGYLDSGVSSPVVTSQYETIACGDVNIPELYGNALDYDGVSIQAFLPFIGWRPLKCKEVMGKRVRITYKIDVYTGTCLALISVISANTDQLLYSFEGNCSVQIPLTASDRTRLISGLITAGVSAFTGNPAGAVAGIASIKQDVDRSGSFSGNAGAMGVKKPYLVITRALDAQASGYNSLYGYPINKSGLLRNFRGFTRVQSVHVDIGKATDYEKRLIEDKLKKGIKI